MEYCQICGAVAVDVWIDPLYPGHVMWLCREDLVELTELVILTMNDKEVKEQ